jgi:1-acyl-sn-glycerol-3-phosphate acyltransferase
MERVLEFIRVILMQGIVRPITWLIFNVILGWKIEGTLVDAPKIVCALAPHTSNLDFLFLLPLAFKFERWPAWIGKKEMFEWPVLGKLFFALNGISLDRDAPIKATKQTISYLNAHDEVILALTPDGTRHYTDHWKRGFYTIAHKLKIPIVFIAMDYSKRVVKVAEPLYTSGDAEKDIVIIQAFYEGVQGKNPENASRIQFEN